jgi:hypothetical protein
MSEVISHIFNVIAPALTNLAGRIGPRIEAFGYAVIALVEPVFDLITVVMGWVAVV